MRSKALHANYSQNQQNQEDQQRDQGQNPPDERNFVAAHDRLLSSETPCPEVCYPNTIEPGGVGVSEGPGARREPDSDPESAT